jgi:hypothetical protein
MRKFGFCMFLMTLALVGRSQNTLATNDPLQLKETEHNFSTIPQGKPVYYSFELINNGPVPVKLDDVHATCGCTTPEWSRDSIPAGGKTIIKVGYNASVAGPFEKYININYDRTLSKQIKITGTVWKAPEGSAPPNASIDLLRKQTFN